MRADERSTARSLHEEYLTLERQLGNKQNQAEALRFLAEIATTEGQDDEARQLLDEGVAIQRELGVTQELCWLVGTLGQVACRQRDLPAARAALEESEALARQLDDEMARARAIAFLSKVARLDQDFDGAAQRWREALALPAAGESQRVLALVGEVLAAVAVWRGDLAAAARLAGVVDGLRREIEMPESRGDPSSTLTADESVARQGLGEAAFNAAWFEGARVPREELIAFLESVARG